MLITNTIQPLLLLSQSRPVTLQHKTLPHEHEPYLLPPPQLLKKRAHPLHLHQVGQVSQYYLFNLALQQCFLKQLHLPNINIIVLKINDQSIDSLEHPNYPSQTLIIIEPILRIQLLSVSRCLLQVTETKSHQR